MRPKNLTEVIIRAYALCTPGSNPHIYIATKIEEFIGDRFLRYTLTQEDKVVRVLKELFQDITGKDGV